MSPTNMSNIGLNRGRYLSYYQVGNAVRMIYIRLLLYQLMLSHLQATYLLKRLICPLLFTLPTNVSDIGLNRGGYLSHCQVCNAVRMIHIGLLLHQLILSHLQAKNPTILICSLLFTSPTNVSDIGLNRGGYLSYCQVGNAVRMIYIGLLLHQLMLSHLQAKNPTIHVTYQRV